MMLIQPCKSIIIGDFNVQSAFYTLFVGRRRKRTVAQAQRSVFTKYYLHPHDTNNKATKKYLVEVEAEASDREQSQREQRQSFSETVPCNRKIK